MDNNLNIYIETTCNPQSYVFRVNKKLIQENDYKIYNRNTRNIEECILVTGLFEIYLEITEIFIKENFISINFCEEISLTNEYLESIKNIINQNISNDNSIFNSLYIDHYLRISKCINEYINPALEMDGGLFIIHNYSLKNKLLIVRTIGYCRNNPSISIDLMQAKNIINKVCNLNISNILPVILNY